MLRGIWKPGRWRGRLVTFGPLLLLATISAFAVHTALAYRNSNEWHIRSADALARLYNIQTLVERSETAQRGFILTEDVSFLDTYYTARHMLLIEIENLLEHVDESTPQGRLAAEWRDVIQEKMGHMDSGVNLVKSHKTNEAVVRVRIGAGRLLMDRVRDKFAEVALVERRLLLMRAARAENDFLLAGRVILIGMFVAFSGIGFIMIALRNEIRRRAGVERDLDSARLRATDASELKSKFLANMSHEIRTPLNGIIGLSKILAETKLDHEQRRYMEIIQDSANSLSALINEILDLSKIESGKMQLEEVHFDLRSLVNSTVSIVEFAAKAKGLNVIVEIPSRIPDFLIGDPLRIRQILLNLLNNAVKFSEKGSIYLRITEAVDSQSALRLTFEVADEGIGMDSVTQNRLFSAFVQGDQSTTREYGGTGLGLVITKQLVELMRGRIVVQSEEGKGTTFRFQINLKTAKYQADAAKIVTGIPADVKVHANIIIAEDNLTNQRVIEAMFKKFGARIHIVENGEELIAALREKPNHYDLILMDCQMPKVDGYEATKRIRAGDAGVESKDVPIIAVTANAIKGDLERCLEVGMNDYMAKPISATDLYVKVSKLLKQNRGAIDHSALQRLIELDDGEASSVLASVIRLFIETVPKDFADLRSAFERNSVEEVSAYGHRLKSSSANVGATRMREMALRLESVVSIEDLEGTRGLLDALENEFLVVARELTLELKKYDAA